jgi:glutamate/tyrosine decarboxylase-like PLP-dependent enzyme
MKYALSRVLPNCCNKGVRTDAQLLCSQKPRCSLVNSSDWTGLGIDNIVRIETDIVTNVMDLRHLEIVLKDFQACGVSVASVVCTIGIADANAFDPVTGVRELTDRHLNPGPYGKSLLECDAVIGWTWMTFGVYDFKTNLLSFSEELLPHLKANYALVDGMKHADAIGIDSHKAGWAPHASLCVLYRDAEGSETLMKRPGSAYLQPR